MFLFKREDKFLRRARKQADRVVALKGEFERLTDEALQAKTAEFRARVQAGESLDDLLPEVFAQVRGCAARARDGTLLCADPRRDYPAQRRHRGNEDGRGQDARGHAARVPERA